MCAYSVIEQQIAFTLADPDRRLVAAALDCDQAIAGQRRFRRTSNGWLLTLARPPLDRLEYKLLITGRNGSTQVLCDPENPERVRTAFGERSVALLPGYRAPAWRTARKVGPALVERLVVESPSLGHIPVDVWCPLGLVAEEPAPILVVNDGPEYAELADLTTYAATMVATVTLPPFRMALVHPVERDEWYTANPAYIAATHSLLDLVSRTYNTTPDPVVMGASLGGLSALLVGLDEASRFGGVVSQSGSFFQPRLDEQESSYPFFERVTRTVGGILDTVTTSRPLVLGMTCGAMEENLANNEAMAAALRRQGHRVSFRAVQDLHNYTAWRDSLDPTLTMVLRSLWGAKG